MISYLQIKDDLTLVHHEIKLKKEAIVKENKTNFIWIFDRSGSMHGLLETLGEQMIELSKELPQNSNLTLGWFSSEGDYNWIVKGFKLSTPDDYVVLEKSIRNNLSTRGCTCFSEILMSTEQVIQDLSVFSDNFSLSFFSDGYPVVSNYKAEIENIKKAITNIKNKITSSMIIGYGSYYNKELLTEIATNLNSIMISSRDIREYKNHILNLIKLSEDCTPKEQVTPPVKNKPLAIFTINDSTVTFNTISDDGFLYVAPQKTKSTNIFYIIQEQPNKKSWDKIDLTKVNFAEDNIVSKAIYAASLVLTQNMKTDLALEFVGKIGDKNIIDLLNNSFTIDEYSNTEKIITDTVFNIQNRFAKGKDPNYLPKPDAFCVFDLVSILLEDDEAKFYPRHKNFKYDRIGVASKPKGDYPKFEADDSVSCKFSSLVWNKDKLNLNVLANIKGKIKFNDVDGKKAKDFGFAEEYPTFVYRNYTIVKDGRVNVKNLYVTSSENSYNIFKNFGIVVDDSFKTDRIYGLDLSNLPSINRKIANGRTSATELCKFVMEEQELKGKIKSLKYLMEHECGSKKDLIAAKSSFSLEQMSFLEANGISIKDGSYAPPTEKEEATDKYVAKTFEIKIAKMSSLPSVDKVLEKIKANKNRTASELLVENGITIFENSKQLLTNDTIKTAWFESTLKDMNKRLNEVRKNIQETKFAVTLAKKSFEEFTSRDQTEIVVNGQLFNFVIGEEVIEI